MVALELYRSKARSRVACTPPFTHVEPLTAGYCCCCCCCTHAQRARFVLAKWIRAQPYVTMEERVAQAALRQAGIMQMANLLAVAAAR